ncbi:olfactory receptor 5V1-like [Gastrophryne carolinensis]
MGNQTVITELYLSGLSDLPSLQLPLFLLFLLVYLLSLTWNMLIIFLIITNSHLHTPMYFFLGNLAGLDLSCSSVTVPRMLFDLLSKKKLISIGACIAQIFFFISFVTSELCLLSVMSYDRYVAICHPLHYMQMMRWKLCIQLVATLWIFGSCYSLAFSLFAIKLTFCASNIIESFVCDLPELLKIACGGVSENVLLTLTLGSIVSFGTLLMTFLPYISILKTVLKMPVNKSKVFSTCSSHLTVVFLFYTSTTFNYLCPKPKVRYSFDKVPSLIYTVLMPMFNPVIYSLRNQELGRALLQCSIHLSR